LRGGEVALEVVFEAELEVEFEVELLSATGSMLVVELSAGAATVVGATVDCV
jgi:hypothetical protein